MTAAGRAPKIYVDREGSYFRNVQSSPAAINQQAERVVDEILENPNSVTTTRNYPRFGNVTEIRSPTGRGIRHASDGKLIGFWEQ